MTKKQAGDFIGLTRTSSWLCYSDWAFVFARGPEGLTNHEMANWLVRECDEVRPSARWSLRDMGSRLCKTQEDHVLYIIQTALGYVESVLCVLLNCDVRFPQSDRLRRCAYSPPAVSRPRTRSPSSSFASTAAMPPLSAQSRRVELAAATQQDIEW